MHSFNDGDTITGEPFRATPIPIIKDLAVDPSSFERIQHAEGYTTVNVGDGPGRQCDPSAQTRRREDHGSRGLHRVRSLRGFLPQ